MATTILDMVQDVLSDMDSDEVNTISGTIESQQIATLIKKRYEAIVERYSLPANKDLFKLQGMGDTNRPTLMRLPDDCMSIEWIGYNTKLNPSDSDNWVRMQYLEPGDFMDQVTQKDSTQSNIQTVTLDNGVKIYIQNDKQPQFYTSFNDREVVMDSFYSSMDATLQGSKTNCYGEKFNTLVINDNTVINLPQHLINLLYTDVVEAAFARWKEGPPARIMQDASRAQVRSQRIKTRFREGQEAVTKTGPDYGRRPRR